MTDNNQPLNKNDKNISRTTTDQPFDSTATSAGTGLATKENRPIITPQTDVPADKGMSNGLAKALVGGLIGATLGTLAGALANKRTSEGVNHAAQGVGNALKNVGEGINLAAKGVGDAVKSVGEGASYAVVGGTLDATKSITQGAKQTAVATLDAIEDTTDNVNQAIIGAVDKVKAASEDAKQSTTGILEADTQSEQQSFKIAKERIVAEKPPVTTSEIGIEKYGETQSYISPSMPEAQIDVAQTTPINEDQAW